MPVTFFDYFWDKEINERLSSYLKHIIHVLENKKKDQIKNLIRSLFRSLFRSFNGDLCFAVNEHHLLSYP